MNKPLLAVIGHGMVGQYFLEQLTERGLHQQYHIVVYGAENRLAYDRVHLSDYFAGRSAGSFSLTSEDFFRRHGIELHSGTSVTAIDRQNKRLFDDKGHEMPYELVVLATGSKAFVPPIPGNIQPGCLTYRTLDDLDAIAARARGSRRGVVIGGGLLGLEAANALRNFGLETHVVEFAPRLMAAQLDDGGAAMLRRKIEYLQVSVHTGKETRQITALGADGLRLEFTDGDCLETDLVLFSAGIRPADLLARKCGLALGARGGIAINSRCATSDDFIFAIGECAAWRDTLYGLVAPGYQMARTLASCLAGEDAVFSGADISTKLKLLGVEVASLGDAHGFTPGSQSFSWTDEPGQIYKKMVVSADSKHLLGAVLVGDSADFSGLQHMLINDIALPEKPESLILPLSAGGAPKGLGVASLPDSAQICSCYNVSKGDIRAAVSAGAHDLQAVKACTKAGTGCGGCLPLVKQVMEYELAQQGVAVKKELCEHFAFTRQELYHLIRFNRIRTFGDLLAQHGQGLGCEVCKPLAASMLASCWNDYPLQPEHLPLQDTNDRYFANIQKDGTYSVVPRMPAGEVTPAGLIAVGTVAARYNLYTKVTGGQRVALFGARMEQLPAIWRELVDAGFETGHAYGKSLRTVKSCVGSTWCRYGVLDSTSLAVRLENRYKGLRAPHKFKLGVSGCTRECAEAQGKDIGAIATEKGWNLYVCGNGGMKPRHADLFAAGLDTERLIALIDRLMMFYIRTADRLQRTSTWLDNLEGGIDYLRRVILDDSLGVCAELEQEMQSVVDSYQCEWQTTLAHEDKLMLFRGFLNSGEPDEGVVMTPNRRQIRPAGPEEKTSSPALTAEVSQDAGRLTPTLDDNGWQPVCLLSEIPMNAGMAARLAHQQIALFKLAPAPDSQNQQPRVFALSNLEAGSGANVLARGLLGDVSGEPVVISPLYKKHFRLRDGYCLDAATLSIKSWPVEIRQNRVWVLARAMAERNDATPAV